MLTKANVDDRDENVFNRLTDNMFCKLFADKGYISQGLFERLFKMSFHILRKKRMATRSPFLIQEMQEILFV